MPDVVYICPGEMWPIPRPIHLSRLANRFAACGACQHRHDTALLSRSALRQLERDQNLPPTAPEFHAEGVQGVFHNQITIATMRRLAAAFATVLRRQLNESAAAAPCDPVVVLAGDGRPITAEFLAAAADGLRYCGCHVRELPAATSAIVSFAQRTLGADGALLLGNLHNWAQKIGIKFWGPGGLPWSQANQPQGSEPPANELAAIKHLLTGPLNRPTRSAGSATRVNVEAEYLHGLEDYFHALRPLKFVLDTSSAALRSLLEQLLARVACRIVDDDDTPDPASEPALAVNLNVKPDPARRLTLSLRQLARRTTAAGADFGVWIDGDAETALVVDERGREVPGANLLVVLARHLQGEQPGAAIVAEPGSHDMGSLESLAHLTVADDSTRRSMAAAMIASRAVLGGGPSGRFWFESSSGGFESSSGPPLSVEQAWHSAPETARSGKAPAPLPCPAPDALHLVAQLLTILSRRDWPLSEVVAHGTVPVNCP